MVSVWATPRMEEWKKRCTLANRIRTGRGTSKSSTLVSVWQLKIHDESRKATEAFNSGNAGAIEYVYSKDPGAVKDLETNIAYCMS